MVFLEIAAEELQHGLLAAGFANGAAAILVHCEGLIRKLWSQLLEDPDEQLPWEAPLIDIARNHYGSRDITVGLGDLFYFQPGHHGYIARKVEIDRTPEGRPEPTPSQFVQGNGSYRIADTTMDECCRLADQLMEALTPQRQQFKECRVTVQRLKYQERYEDFEDLAAMSQNSLARWGRLGFQLDRHRGRLDGPLARKGVSDVMGAMMMLPGLGKLPGWVNKSLNPKQSRASDMRLVERAHSDERYFTALCGTRANVRTEVHIGKQWIELPVGLTSFAVFPGNLAQRAFGLTPTMHRVVHTGQTLPASAIDRRTGNVTLMIGGV
ncbi:MAG: hypothetical protein JJE34_04325 [Alphaproteobacteria bacterium]|nr:hypothetical protein [Alphaproteobacteria bacterium]